MGGRQSERRRDVLFRAAEGLICHTFTANDAMIGSHESGETFNTLFAGGTPKPGWEARKYREFVRKNLTPIVGCTRQRFMPRLS